MRGVRRGLHGAERMIYRPEIDGLRAVAVLPVIAFHAGVAAIPGGFVGVDVFFVISGYLITTILLREMDTGTFSLLGFYERRARRILPALFLVMAATTALAVLWMLPGPTERFGRHLSMTALFLSNIFLSETGGYFAPSAELRPLLHTWSLAVEEQFYILFPILLGLAWRVGRGAGVAVAAGVAGTLSLGFAHSELTQGGERFFLLAARGWELLAGAGAALWLRGASAPARSALDAGAVPGLALVAAAMVLPDTEGALRDWRIPMAVAGTVLIVICAQPGSRVARVLSWPLPVGIGLISYSAYLWHQPLFALARHRMITDPPPALMAGLALGAIALGWLSWRFVERPFRDPARIGRRVILGGTVAGILGFVAVGEAMHRTEGLLFLGVFPRDAVKMADRHTPTPKGFADCAPGAMPVADTCVFHPGESGRVALWGDSHAIAIADVLAHWMQRNGIATENFARPACAPVPGLTREDRVRCVTHNRAVFSYLLSDEAPEVVILHARWAVLMNRSGFDNGEGGREPGGRIVIRSADGGTRLGPAAVAREIAETVTALRAAGRTVVLVGNVPEAGWNVPLTLARMLAFGGGPPRPLSTPAERIAARDQGTRALFTALAARDDGVVLISPSDLVCDTVLPGRCVQEADGKPLYRDDDHLSRDGAKRLLLHMMPLLEDAGVIARARGG